MRLKRNLFLIASSLLLANSLLAAPLIRGYVLPMPNQFWPNTTNSIFSGTIDQQNSAEGNPDVYCNKQGNNYRLPAAGEIYGIHRSINPWGPSAGVTPAHFSNYKNGDINQERLPDISERAIGAGLINEWGTLKSYDSLNLEDTVLPANVSSPNARALTPEEVKFWVTEPTLADVSNGRLLMDLDGQLVGSKEDKDPESQWRVICVADVGVTKDTAQNETPELETPEAETN